MKKTEQKRKPLVATLGDLNRPLRVRPVRVMGRDWWAVDAEDIWPGMVMDLRRLGFESMGWGEEVLVREGEPEYEPQMEGPGALSGLKPYPTIHPTIQIHKEFAPVDYSKYADEELVYIDEPDVDEEDEIGEDETLEREELEGPFDE